MWRERKMKLGAPACGDVAMDLADTADDISRLRKRDRRHAEHCLRCQADVAQYRRLARAMHGLREVRVEPEPGFVTEVLTGLDDEPALAPRTLLSGRRIAYAGGLAAATAATAVSAVVITARSRRARLVG